MYGKSKRQPEKNKKTKWAFTVVKVPCIRRDNLLGGNWSKNVFQEKTRVFYTVAFW